MRTAAIVAGRVFGILLALILLAFADPMSKVGADTTIEGAVAQTTGIQRTVTATLQSIAVERAAEIQSDFSHNGIQTAEILYWANAARLNEDCDGYAVKCAVDAWVVSPPHHEVMFNPALTDIGCAMATNDEGTAWLVCAFASSGIGEASTYQPPAEPAVVALPDTAMAAP